MSKVSPFLLCKTRLNVLIFLNMFSISCLEIKICNTVFKNTVLTLFILLICKEHISKIYTFLFTEKICDLLISIWLCYFELWCWRRLLRVSWTARRSNQSILKEISPGISLEGMIQSWNSSTLATPCEELTHWKRHWCWEGLGAGGKGSDRGWDGWMASLTRWTWVWVNSGRWWWTGRPGVLQFMG